MSRIVPACEQVQATDPIRSNWVAANAGAGKTHVLTQRVARLLLAGAAPEKILCLTYTKAAAAEMQTRLFRMLGEWAMAPEAELAQRLGDLAGSDAPLRDQAALAEARRLFARALETPGGLKIQTIHAFCERLLRRFPLEAGVSPRFEVMDDAQSDLVLSRLRAEMAEDAESGADDAFDRAARTQNEGGIEQLATAAMTHRGHILPGDPGPALQAHLGLGTGEDPAELARLALNELNRRELAGLAAVLGTTGGKREQEIAGLVHDWQAAMPPDPLGFAEELAGKLLTKADTRPKSGLGTKAVLGARPQADAEFDRLCDWAARLRDRLRAATIADRTADLHAFGAALLGRLEVVKGRRGLLDFDDLVSRARALLTEQHMRAWVLYKLDQGIDHILVDEAQDTSPRQWDVIAAIAEEFLAGEGARPAGRSVFVVGDEKQSIYSFQGAEPRAFGEMRAHFEGRLRDLGTPLGQPRLETSYRSAPAILDFVDAVFDGPAAAALTSTGDAVRHRAHRAQDQGRVDLWPLIPPAEKTDDGEWWKPVDAPPPEDPKLLLAASVAGHIADLTSGARRPARNGAPGDPVRPGDVLVLVSARDRLAWGIIDGLKQRGIAVAGADRLSLTAELAVKDLMALMRIVLMPSDDLSLAALLRSPLCGLNEEALFDLAYDRGEATLWQALDASPAHAEIAAFLKDMSGQADFERPYEFLERALIRHDARRKLIARLGPEAEDPIDEMLVQALVFEARETPSLAGFLAWLETGEITVKREMDRGTGAVRVMTVHGAKGLEAPVVVLPDTITAGQPGGGGRPAIFEIEGAGNTPNLLVWAARKEEDDACTRAAREAQEARAQAERLRLLYVALTRAEDWLILCGAGSKNARAESWYHALEEGMARLGARDGTTVRSLPSPTGEGELRRFESGAAATETPVTGEAAALAPDHARPGWLRPAPVEVKLDRGSPSGLGAGLELAQPGEGRDPETARRRGSAIHLLLDRLRALPVAERATAGETMLAHGFADLDPAIRVGALDEALAVLEMPGAAAVFGPEGLEEVSVAIDPPAGGARMIGRIDRLVPAADEVLVVDYKTDSAPPTDPGGVPMAYLAQLGAYAAAVGPGWPGKRVALAILWTAGPALMRIDPEAADHAFRTVSFARTRHS